CQHSPAARITAGSTQPPVTEPATSPVAETARAAPGSCGADPARSTTVPRATGTPAAVQRSSELRTSRIAAEDSSGRRRRRESSECAPVQTPAATLRFAVVPRGLLADALLVAGGAGLIAASAQVSLKLPFTPVPITGQT